MALLQLPNELLHTISDLTRPYAFENLVLTCKHIYSAAQPLLSRHNELRRRYRHFRFARTDENPESRRSADSLTWFVPQLLLDIARDPSVAAYIVHADLGTRNHTEDYYRQGDNKFRDVVQQLDVPENKDLLRGLVRESWFLKSINANSEKWLDCILEDDRQWDEPCEFGLMFLMTFLVNAESLILPGEWSSANAEPRENREGGIEPYQYEVSQLMQYLVTLANDGTTNQWPLKKLRQLLPSREVDTQFGMEMIAIAPFLSLQSMRDVRHASGKYMCYAGAPSWDNMYPVIGPNIESLELLDYVIDAGAATALFKDMKKLRKLKMEYCMKDELGEEWKANEFVQNLMSVLGSQLELFSLRIGWMYDNEDPVTDLSGFTALRELELDVELFHRWGMEEDDEEDDSQAKDSELSILDMLPDSLPSLKELRFQCLPMNMDVKRLEILLRDFGSSKSLQLPNLETTEVHLETQDGTTVRLFGDQEEAVRQAQKTCREVGNIEVTMDEEVEL